MNQPSALVLSPRDIARYHVEGFISLPAITTPDEVARLRTIYDGLFARRAGHEKGNHFDLLGDESTTRDPREQVPQILGPENHAPELKQSQAWANVVAIAEQLFGGPPDHLGTHAIMKPPGCPKPTPWHQDEAYWARHQDQCSFSLWLPLQDVDQTSGCMHFVARSHWGEILPHRPGAGNAKVHGLELACALPEPESITAVPLRAGGCTIHHQRTLHFTTANQGAVPRRAWIFVASMIGRPRLNPKVLPWLDEQKTLRADRRKAWEESQVGADSPAGAGVRSPTG